MSRLAVFTSVLAVALLVVASPGETAPPRCSHSGGQCASNADCCSGENVCSEGVCRSSPVGGLSCNRGGGRCDTSDTCCPGFTCAGGTPGSAWPTGVCTASASCTPMDSPCGRGTSCCDGLVCHAGACVLPSLAGPQSCGAPDAACGSDAECCLGLSCTAGRCSAPVGPYRDAGETCGLQAPCYLGNTCINGLCVDNVVLHQALQDSASRAQARGASVRQPGERCGPKDVCTSGHTCDGVCRPSSEGGEDSAAETHTTLPIPANSRVRYRERGAGTIYGRVHKSP